MIRSLTGLIHTIASVAALLLGAFVFFSRKRGRLHKSLGYLYSVSMIIVIVTAVSIYHLTRSFNILHVAAFVSSISLTLGLDAAMARTPRENWLERHYYWMSWSYIGLFAAFLAETAARVLLPYLISRGFRSAGIFWALFGVVSFLVCWWGAILVNRNQKIIPGYTPKARSAE